MFEKKKIGFVYTVEHIGVDGKVKSVETVENIIPLVGINYILAAALTAGAQYSTWYIGLFEANRTPLASDTMTTLLADCEESDNYGGVGNTNRSNVNGTDNSFPAVVDGASTTTSDPAIFTFTTAATIQGGFITTGVTIGNTSGLLISAVKFTSPKVMAAGEYLRVPVGIAMASV